MQSPDSPVSSQKLLGLIRRIPTGLAGAAFWLGMWFCALFVRRFIPGGFGTGMQVPSVPGRAQEKQGPSHFVVQQAPCAQKPLAHSASAEQAAGCGLPQDPSTHGMPCAQSSAVAQKS